MSTSCEAVALDLRNYLSFAGGSSSLRPKRQTILPQSEGQAVNHIYEMHYLYLYIPGRFIHLESGALLVSVP